MFYIRILAILGIITLLVTFSGIPVAWKDIFHVVVGIVILVLAWLRYQVMRERKEAKKASITYEETTTIINQ